VIAALNLASTSACPEDGSQWNATAAPAAAPGAKKTRSQRESGQTAAEMARLIRA
jgi:hypothetical protein